MLRVCKEESPLPPKLALIKTPWWPQLDADTQGATANWSNI